MNKLTAQIIIGVLLLLLGSTVMLGWVLQLPKLTQILPGYPAMVFNTALNFALSSAALLLPAFLPSRTVQYQAGLGGFLIVFNLLVLTQSLFGIDLGLDGATLHKRLQYDHPHPGRMAPGTSLAFIIFGALLLRDQLKPLAGYLVHSLQELRERSFGRRGKEQQIHTIVENVVDGIITIDESGTIESFNNGATKIFGYSPEEIMGKKVKTLMPEKIHGKHQNCLLNLNAVPLPATGKHVELMGMHKDGSYMPLELAVNETRLGDRRLFVGVVRNITQRKQAEAELIRAKERLDLALEGSHLALFEWNIVTGEVYLSEHWATLIGAEPGPTYTTFGELEQLVHPDDKPMMRKLIYYDALKGHTPYYRAEHRVRTRSGKWIWIQSHGKIVQRDANGWALRMIGTNADITMRKEAEQRLVFLAEHDQLTKLPNRHLFHDRLAQALSRSKRNKELMSLMYLDIDYFKRINDELGHAIGDALLHGLAERLKQSVRDTDTVARLGGDEFAIIMENLHRPDDAMRIAEKIISALHPVFSLEHCKVNTTASIGIAFFSGTTDMSGDTLVKMADDAMYQAKKNGRNSYQVYQYSPSDSKEERP